jgi:hypothetical protein
MENHGVEECLCLDEQKTISYVYPLLAAHLRLLLMRSDQSMQQLSSSSRTTYKMQ